MIEKYNYVPTKAKERFTLFGKSMKFRRVWNGPRGRGRLARLVWDVMRMAERARLR